MVAALNWRRATDPWVRGVAKLILDQGSGIYRLKPESKE